jgi:hypothetical protein
MKALKQPAISLVTSAFFALACPALFAAETQLDVSHIIDKATAESVLDGPVRAPAPRNSQGGDGYYSKCNYYSATPGKTLVIRVYQAGAGYDPYKELEQVIETSGAMRSITGLGDKARLSSGEESGLPARTIMLYVIKGNALVTVGLAGLDDDAVATERARTVAEKILAEL